MISFRKINEENFKAIIEMKRPEGETYVASNAVSLAQAWLYRENGDVYPFAIYAGERPVGFMLLDEDVEKRRLLLWRIMFPPEHTGKGYGTEAIRLLISLARKSGKYDGLFLTYAPDNVIAEHVYKKLGFTLTGEVNEEYGELEMCFDLKVTRG